MASAREKSATMRIEPFADYPTLLISRNPSAASPITPPGRVRAKAPAISLGLSSVIEATLVLVRPKLFRWSRQPSKKFNVCNRTDTQAYFGDGTAYAGMWRFAGTEKKLDEVPHYFVFVAWARRLLPH